MRFTRVIIAGGRDFNNYEFLSEKVKENILINTEIVTGGAKGADALGKRFAREYRFPLTVFPADWDRYGKAAGPIRNRKMAEYGDMLIAFWDGKSAGTKNMIDTARKKKLKCLIFNY